MVQVYVNIQLQPDMQVLYYCGTYELPGEMYMAETKRGYAPVMLAAVALAGLAALGAYFFMDGKKTPSTSQSPVAVRSTVGGSGREGVIASSDRTSVQGGVTVQALTESGQSLPAVTQGADVTSASVAPSPIPSGNVGSTMGETTFSTVTRSAPEGRLRADLGADDTSTTGMLVPPGEGGTAPRQETSSRADSSVPQVGIRPTAGEDGVVRLVFVEDLAAFLVLNYWPRGAHPAATRSGISTVSLQWANLRYGAEMPGITGGEGNPSRARSRVLSYVLTPSVVNALYGMYAERFLVALKTRSDMRIVGEPGSERYLTSAEKKEMLRIYASYASQIGNALNRYTADPAMPGRVRLYTNAADAVEIARRAYLECVDAYEAIRHGGGRQQINRTRAAVEQAAGTYQKSIVRREEAKNNLIKAMGGKAESGDTLVYVASWAARRGEGSKEGLRTCGDVILSMVDKLAGAAR